MIAKLNAKLSYSRIELHPLPTEDARRESFCAVVFYTEFVLSYGMDWRTTLPCPYSRRGRDVFFFCCLPTFGREEDDYTGI